jgi:hypothetical protein
MKVHGKRTLLTAAIGLLAISVPLLAHHGAAAYDMTKSTAAKGAVTDFKFTNPHVLIYIASKNDKGEVEKWQGELTSPNRLARSGWNQTTLKVGDQITLIGAPAKNGVHTLWITKILGTDGQPMDLAVGD